MARKYSNGTAAFAASFKYTSAIPIDNRMVVATLSDLTDDATWKTNGISAAYVGIAVYVESENALYVLTNAAYGTSDNWKKVATVDQVTGGTIYKGVKNSLTELNAVSSPSNGDMWYVTHAALETDTDWGSEDGAFYIHNGSSWDKINKEDAAFATIAGSANQLTTGREINGLGFDGSKSVTNYVECTTDANVAAKLVTLTDVSVEQGTEIRIKFNNANTAVNPTLNGIPVMRGEEVFDTWEAGAVVTLTCVGTGVNKKWQAHEVEGQSIILRNTSKVDYATFDFSNQEGVEISPSAAPIGDESMDVRETLFAAMLNLAQNPDGKLHFVKFKGRRYKFDIDGFSSSSDGDSVTFSFLYRQYKTLGAEQHAKMITIEWGKKIVNDAVVFNYNYIVSSLIGGGTDISTLATKTEVNELANRVASVENNMKWYDLDE